MIQMIGVSINCSLSLNVTESYACFLVCTPTCIHSVHVYMHTLLLSHYVSHSDVEHAISQASRATTVPVGSDHFSGYIIKR